MSRLQLQSQMGDGFYRDPWGGVLEFATAKQGTETWWTVSRTGGKDLACRLQ